MRFASSPESPTASPPWTLIADTISRLTLPTSTMRAISSVSASVTRSPSLNSGCIPRRLSELSDLRAASVHDHRQDPDRAQEHDVLGERSERLCF